MKLKSLCILIGLLTCAELICAGAVNAQQVKPIVPDIARPLPLSAVRITGGPLARARSERRISPKAFV
jgi:hypothetical protein